jgi:hypothetical protein
VGKSTFTVRTDAVFTAGGTAHFYGGKVKLTEEEAKPLLRQGKVSRNEPPRTARPRARPANVGR